MMQSIYEFSANRLTGEPVNLRDFTGKVLLIVNTASKCGFTPQYEELETLYEKYRGRGLEILGFPCNQFGSQEPGDAVQIGTFCQKNYGVSFPMFEKIDVNGDGAHPLYRYLKGAAAGLFGTESIKWNFTKFLVDREGHMVRRYAPVTKPSAMATDIERLLG
jgi:glutathione peroxidase